MQQLANGQYLGVNAFERRFNGLITTQNRYEANLYSEWHYHESPYFAFILKGGSVEKRKPAETECLPGMLLFYSTQEKHKNERYQAGSRNFSLEFDDDWLKQMGIDRRSFEGGFVIEDQQTKDLFLKLMLETKSQSNETLLAIEVLAVNLLGYFSKAKSNYSTAPDWLIQIKHLLHDVPRETFSLTELAAISGVHPVTISKLFPRFFGVGVGDYIRGIKLEKSLGLLAKRHIPIETIALQCGFADHSHFCRVFKERKGITPSHYRQFLFG